VRPLTIATLVLLFAYGVIATAIGLFAEGRVVLAASGPLALFIASALSDWLSPRAKRSSCSPEGMLR